MAILALISFQLLYSYVANGTSHVADAQLRAVFQHLSSAVFQCGQILDIALPTMKNPNSYGLTIVIYRQIAVLLLRPDDCAKCLCNKHAQMPG